MELALLRVRPRHGTPRLFSCHTTQSEAPGQSQGFSASILACIVLSLGYCGMEGWICFIIAFASSARRCFSSWSRRSSSTASSFARF